MTVIRDRKHMFLGSNCRSGFTLLEMLTATAVSLIVIAALLAMLNQGLRMWLDSRNTTQAFQTAANTFETLTRSLSQAVLQTYWSYDNPSLPQKYVRASELHFILGSTSALLGVNTNSYPGSAVFFQAPMGKSQAGLGSQLPSRLNAVGFFTGFGDTPNLPHVLQPIIQPRYRYRLFEWKEPTDRLGVYLSDQGTAWFKQPLSGEIQTNTDVVPLGENIIGLYAVVQYPEAGNKWGQSFSYDSRDKTSTDTFNQLPPQIQVALVAIDEPSAMRLAARYGANPPPISPPDGSFTDPAHFDDDLTAWEQSLRNHDPHVNCRIFRTTIQIPNSRWSME